MNILQSGACGEPDAVVTAVAGMSKKHLSPRKTPISRHVEGISGRFGDILAAAVFALAVVLDGCETGTDTTNNSGESIVDSSDFPGGTPGQTFEVSATEQWNAALTAIRNGGNGKSYAIIVTADIDVEGNGDGFAYTFGSVTGVTVAITGAAGRKLSVSGYGSLLNVNAGQNVIVRNIILKGHSDNGLAALVRVSGGALDMKGGAAVSGNSSSSSGGEVYVSGGTFRIAGGTVYGYTEGDPNSNVCKDAGGAVQSNQGTVLYGSAQYGSFNGDNWTGTDIPLSGEYNNGYLDTTITVVNGVLQ